MEKTTITFSANEQKLQKTGGIDCYASNTVAYIEARFDLGENWSGYDSVRAVWWNDYNKTVATVLDSDESCIVPYEVLTRKGAVKVNLVGSIAENDVLTDRLTTCPVIALTIKCNAKTDGDNTQPITPSEYEQFVGIVKADADRAEAGAESAEASAQSASESATASANSATSSAQSATASAQSEQNASESAQSAENAKDDAEDARDKILGMRATATTLEAGSDATASYSDGVLALGIPRGDKGVKGDTGDTGAIPNISIGTVSTLEPTEDATATITGTTEDPVLNLGIPKGDTGEVSLEDLETLLPTETASGSIVTITDGQAIVPAKSLKVALEPIQEGSGTPSPDNVRPISGRTEVVTWNDPMYGRTIEWNQLVKNGDFDGTTSWGKEYGNISASNNELTYTATSIGVNFYENQVTQYGFSVPSNHVVFMTAETYAPYSNGFYMSMRTNNVGQSGVGISNVPLTPNIWNRKSKVAKLTNNLTDIAFYWNMNTNYHTGDSVKLRNVMLLDLTQMFGSTKAEEIYAMEQAHTGDGVAYIESLFPLDYYAYNAGETTCVSAVNGNPYYTYTTTLGRTVYGGTLDVVIGTLTVTHGYIASYNGETLPSSWISDRDAYVSGTTPTVGAEVVYELAEPQTYQLTPQQVELLQGENNVWSDGDVTIVYNADIQKWVEKQLS